MSEENQLKVTSQAAGNKTLRDLSKKLYHLCDYLLAVREVCAGKKKKTWLEKHKKHFKANRVEEVLAALSPHH